MATAFPLAWPEGWARTPVHKRTRAKYKVGAAQAAEELVRELKMLGARSIIISSNIPLRRDGSHYVNDGNFQDPGVAVYWQDQKHGERVMACDRWLKVHENERAIGLAVNALRTIDRCGASQILDRAFSAFGALPAAATAPKVIPWWEVLEFPEALLSHLTLPVVEARYREKAATAHPDKGGSVEAMTVLNRAVGEARTHYGKGTG